MLEAAPAYQSAAVTLAGLVASGHEHESLALATDYSNLPSFAPGHSERDLEEESSLGLDPILKGTNLTDEEARNHASFVKDDVPLPGRDVSLIARLSF